MWDLILVHNLFKGDLFYTHANQTIKKCSREPYINKQGTLCVDYSLNGASYTDYFYKGDKCYVKSKI